MSTRKHLLSVAMLVTLAAMFTPAPADDFAPPPWRGLTRTTLQGWEFLNNPDPITDPIAPDDPVGLVVGNGGGTPHATLKGLFWDPADGDGGLITDGTKPGSILLYIPNWRDKEPIKLIRVQITYIGNQAPSIAAINGLDGGGKKGKRVDGSPAGPPVAVDPNHVYEDWIMQPNPDWENINLIVPAGTLVDEIIVDTISFPEPVSAALLGLGTLCLLHRRR